MIAKASRGRGGRATEREPVNLGVISEPFGDTGHQRYRFPNKALASGKWPSRQFFLTHDEARRQGQGFDAWELRGIPAFEVKATGHARNAAGVRVGASASSKLARKILADPSAGRGGALDRAGRQSLVGQGDLRAESFVFGCARRDSNPRPTGSKLCRAPSAGRHGVVFCSGCGFIASRIVRFFRRFPPAWLSNWLSKLFQTESASYPLSISSKYQEKRIDLPSRGWLLCGNAQSWLINWPLGFGVLSFPRFAILASVPPQTWGPVPIP